MTDEQKATQEKQAPFDTTSCMAMMEKMMAQKGGGCDCAGMMAQMMGSMASMSSMGSCCGGQEETEEKAPPETPQNA